MIAARPLGSALPTSCELLRQQIFSNPMMAKQLTSQYASCIAAQRGATTSSSKTGAPSGSSGIVTSTVSTASAASASTWAKNHQTAIGVGVVAAVAAGLILWLL